MDNPNAAIYLAPYFLPLFTIPLLIARPFVEPTGNIIRIVDFFIGFTLSFHYFGLFKEFSPRQPDIAETGLLFSAGMTIVLNLVFLVIILGVVTGGHSQILEYFRLSLAAAPEYYQAVLDQLRRWL